MTTMVTVLARVVLTLLALLLAAALTVTEVVLVVLVALALDLVVVVVVMVLALRLLGLLRGLGVTLTAFLLARVVLRLGLLAALA